jgi:predicted secreted protein
MAQPTPTPATPPTPTAAELAAALDQFRRLIDPQLLEALQPVGPACVYTPWVTVWLLVYQRLNQNATLEAAVAELIQSVDAFSLTNKRAREGTLSTNTGTYSQARTRLEVAATEAVADHVSQAVTGSTPPSWQGRRVFLLDGTTAALPSEDGLRKRWPVGRTESAWPIALLVVAHELASGAVVRPEVGAMYGPHADSELSLAKRMVARLPAKSVVMADRNFGVFGFVHAAQAAGHDTLTRLTKPRFESLKKAAQPAGPGVWTLQWTPTQANRLSNPELPADAAMTVRLHEFVGTSGQTLWIVTTLDASTAALAALYAKRWDVETDIRQFKQTLECQALRGKSEAMILKELAIAAVSYNLVVQVRRIAAEQAQLPPRRLSFTGVWSLVTIVLLQPNDWTAEEWLKKFAWVLRGAVQRKLPNRPGRSYPRKVLNRSRSKFPQKNRQIPSQDSK